jgi:cell division initiation protein
MDLTPSALREVEFREKLRGYNPADVDAFLEEVAGAVDALLARLRTAEEVGSRVAQAPTLDGIRAATLSEETVARALLVAQYTADRSLAEAEDLARTIEAQARADAVRLMVAAEDRIEAGAGEARRAAEARIEELDQRRKALEQEIDWLWSWVARRRDELAEALWDQAPWSPSDAPSRARMVDLVAEEPIVDLAAAERQPSERLT